ncbi:MAG TPA: SIMPL domain-containing protein [Candidatus Paceibacterota bacterium]|nr:SIMPL domain-containing protein [Candidatus Paceibacterota bacterium]
MTKLQKMLAGWVGLALAVVLIAFLGVLTKQASETAATTNTVSFSGTGKVLAKPDVAIIDLSIVTQAATSKAAQDSNSTKSAAVMSFLKSQNIDDKDIQTSAYNIYPQYDYTDGKSKLTGYQVNETIEVKVRDLTKTDTVLAGVVAAGANQIGQLQLTIDNPDALQAQAREAAIKDAQSKADTLKSQLGIKLGRIVDFTENSNSVIPPIMYDKSVVGLGSGAVPAPEIATGQNEITDNVTVTYQIR